jgi:hypothetical protein
VYKVNENGCDRRTDVTVVTHLQQWFARELRDHVKDLISEFARGELNANHWIGVIESVAL